MASKQKKQAEETPEGKSRVSAKALLQRIRDRFKVMTEADQENRKKALEDIKFVHEPGAQWDPDIKKERGDRPCYEFNKLRVTGNKANDKVYYRHSGFPGGIYGTKFKDMQAKHPGRALEKAVKGMLPKGPLGFAMVKKLKVYAGGSHPHAAQQPKVLEI